MVRTRAAAPGVPPWPDRADRRAVPAVVVGAVLALALAGCASSVPGSAHAEGEGPSPDATSAEAAPSTPTSGRPTVTVQPDGPALAPTTGSTTAGSGTTVPRPMPGQILPTSPSNPSPLPLPTVVLPPPSDTPRALPTRTPRPRSTGSPTLPGPSDGNGPASPVDALPLTADVVRDECLLDAAGAAALLGTPVGRPAEKEVERPDGSRTRSCYAVGTGQSPSPGLAVNVYRVNHTTPAGFVRSAAGGRALAGIGQAAVLLDTVGGSTLQVATPRYLITLSVVDIYPSEARWQAAGKAVVAAATRR